MERHHENVRIDRNGYAYFISLTQSNKLPYNFSVKVERYHIDISYSGDEHLTNGKVIHHNIYEAHQFNNAYANYKYHLTKIKKL